MKRIFLAKRSLAMCVAVYCFALLLSPADVKAQCQPFISIDGNNTSAKSVALPIWLRAGQVLGMNAAVPSVSVIEFTENSGALEYSRVVDVTTTSTVPTGKVWKIESIIITPLIGNVLSTATYTTSGTFTIPSCTNYVCIEVWGAGGGGGTCSGCASNSGGAGGGGGGGYGTGCFTVTPGGSLSVSIGAGGTAGNTGGTTNVGGLISATGGGGGSPGVGGVGGAGGTSTAYVQMTGTPGTNGTLSGSGGVSGGAGANGGAGGSGGQSTTAGTAPGGGGGSGATVNGNPVSGKPGGAGQAKISW
ncbi:MAG: hypothetical protein IT223_12555 [Crocinitomicaceae bacterium]|nr:hypothetical protein [Crocinitomicaceae bacterium]